MSVPKTGRQLQFSVLNANFMMSEGLVILLQTPFVRYFVEPFSWASPLGTRGTLMVSSVMVYQAFLKYVVTNCFFVCSKSCGALSLSPLMFEFVLNFLSAHMFPKAYLLFCGSHHRSWCPKPFMLLLPFHSSHLPASLFVSSYCSLLFLSHEVNVMN